MLTLDEIKKRLKGRNYSEVAREIKCTRAYISAIARGVPVNPSYFFIKKLSDYLEGEANG